MPDVGMAAYQMSRQRRLIAACEKWWPRTGPHGWRICQRTKISLRFRSRRRPSLGTGDNAAHLAAVAAMNGKFVVGAWRTPSAGHGHVAVIVDTNYSSNTVPHRTRALAYWGTVGSEGEMHALHSKSWGTAKRSQVVYSAIDLSWWRLDTSVEILNS